MKTKKTFDCVKMMRDIRSKINAEIKKNKTPFNANWSFNFTAS